MMPVITQMSIQAHLLFNQLEVAQTKIDALERENTVLRGQIATIKLEHRKTILVVDSHAKSIDCDKVKKTLGGVLVVAKAYNTVPTEDSRFPEKAQVSVVPQKLKQNPHTSDLILQLSCNDISNMAAWQDPKKMFDAARESTKCTIQIAEKSLQENPGLKRVLVFNIYHTC